MTSIHQDRVIITFNVNKLNLYVYNVDTKDRFMTFHPFYCMKTEGYIKIITELQIRDECLFAKQVK